MSTISEANFGPLIAYLVPGATTLAGLTPYSETLRRWFAIGSENAPTIGGFLFLTVAALATGMTVSAVRWALIDTLHARTGLPQPPLNFARLGENVAAFELLINIHYRHYQFCANMFVASAVAYLGYRFRHGLVWSIDVFDLAFVVLELIFFATSRDTLKKYYVRSEQLLAAQGSD